MAVTKDRTSAHDAALKPARASALAAHDRVVELTIGIWQAERDGEDAALLRLALAAARGEAERLTQARADLDAPGVAAGLDRNLPEWKPRIRAKLRELDDLFERARIATAELQSLGQQARGDYAHDAYDSS